MSDEAVTKVCRKHGGDPLPLSAFPHNKAYPDGYDRMCKACWKARKTVGWAGGSSKKTKTKPEEPPEMEEIPNYIELVTLRALKDLPRVKKVDGVELNVTLFEWSGSILAGLNYCKKRQGNHGNIVYSYKTNRHFVEVEMEQLNG